jgi:electron transfer flavoprotein beta subunit
MAIKIVSAVQLVPDLVEELVIDPASNQLDRTSIRWVLNEFDDYAIEQSILLKERNGGKVTVIAPDFEGAEDVLFNAAAKGADELLKLCADFEGDFNQHAMARLFAPFVKQAQPDLVLTGVQVHFQNDGALGPILAQELGWPYTGYVSGIRIDNGKAIVRKEYPGGVIAELEVTLPAVIGVQSADTPPRYVSISKIRQVMKTAKIAEEEAGDLDLNGGLPVQRLFQPESTAHATMIEGDTAEVSTRLVAIFKEAGLI